MNSKVRGLFAGAYLFLLLAAGTVIFGAVVLAGVDAVTRAQLAEPPLRSWGNGRVLDELGEANQVAGCDQIVGQPGMTARFYVNESHRRLIVVCTPS